MSGTGVWRSVLFPHLWRSTTTKCHRPAEGEKPSRGDVKDGGPGVPKLPRRWRISSWPHLCGRVSQTGLPFMCCQSVQELQVFLLRRLWLRTMAGAVLSKSLATTVQRAQAWVLGRRDFAVESAAGRVCREACERSDSTRHQVDERRIEVIVDGFPLFHDAQLAIDTTLASEQGRSGKRQMCERGWSSVGSGKSPPGISKF